MNRIKIVFLLSFLLIAVSCEKKGDADNRFSEEAVLASAGQEISAEAYAEVFYSKEMATAVYEPSEGCYLGAYILSDKIADYDIVKFEELTEKEHALYSYNTKISAAFPTEWILKCIANMKTPNIFLYPESIENPYNLDYVEMASKKFGEFYVPMFIHFYPVEGSMYNPEEYIEFYRKAREIFKKNASNAVFVWTVSEENLPFMNSFYPGDDAVDWAGLSIYKKIADGETNYKSNVMDKIDYFYYGFQDKKPIMLSRLGISHFSGYDHIYFSEDAGKEIESIYRSIEENYPRIKAVNYMNFNGLDPVNQTQKPDNFSVTDNENVLKYYAEAVSGSNFLSNVDFGAGEEKLYQNINSNYKACFYQGNYYISEMALAYEIKDEDILKQTDYKILDNEKYYNMDLLKKEHEITFDVNKNQHKIIVKYK